MADLFAETKSTNLLPTLLISPVTAEVTRGGGVDIPVKVASAYGGEVRIEISSPGKYGTITPLGRYTSSTQLLRYTCAQNAIVGEDTFRFRVKSPGYAWNTYLGRVIIKSPPGVLKVDPPVLKFGDVMLGEGRSGFVQLSNQFGSSVSGSFYATAPFSLPEGGEFHLSEGESKTIKVSFVPTEITSYEAILKTAPVIPNLPRIILNGSGKKPFLLSTNKISLNYQKKQDFLSIKNLTTNTLLLQWSDYSSLELPPLDPISGQSSEKLAISIDSMNLATGSKRVFCPHIGNGSYSELIEITADGPPEQLVLNKLNNRAIIQSTFGQFIQLNGVIHNGSFSSHDAELVLMDQWGGGITRTTVKVPPTCDQPFELQFSPQSPGPTTVTVTLLENGERVSEASWRVSMMTQPVSLAAPSSTTVGKVPVEESKDANNLTPRSAPKEERDMYAIWSPQAHHYRYGLTGSKLVLNWRYYGTSDAGFVIKKEVPRNVITDRSGDSTGNDWVDVKGIPKFSNGEWHLEVPMPFPGNYTYIVYPNIYRNNQGEDKNVPIAPLSFHVSWFDFTKPYLLLGSFIAVVTLLIKWIRRKLS
jgi:hypothetical protein